MPDHHPFPPALRRHYLFAALDETQRARLAAHMRTRPFETGEPLFSQNEAAPTFFVLQSGAVKLYRLSPAGQEKIMRLIGAGQSFAESILFMQVPRYPVHAAGVRAGRLLAVEREAFLGVLRESFETCLAVMAQMTARIQSHWDEIEALSFANSHYRVVHYLLGLVPQHATRALSVKLPARKALIAAQLAMTPETFSRVLRALADIGLIEVHGGEVRIRDLALLRGHRY